jgi:hypothetical protein
MARTLLLDRDVWDLCLDASGNIAVASEPYSLAQDAASAIRLFAGELFYDRTLGVPYFDQILGHFPPIALMKAQYEAAALRVPGVTGAQCFFSTIQGRQLTGQVQVTDVDGNVTAAGF